MRFQSETLVLKFFRTVVWTDTNKFATESVDRKTQKPEHQLQETRKKKNNILALPIHEH